MPSSPRKLQHWEPGTVVGEACTGGIEALVGGSRTAICGLDRLQKSGVHPFS